MKRKLLAIPLAWCFLTTDAPAQTAAELPAGFVFENQAPEKSAWTVTCAYEAGEEEAQTQRAAYEAAMRKMAEGNPELSKFLAKHPNVAILKPRVERIVVTKVGKNRREEIFHAGGKKEERWELNSTYLQKDPFTGRIFLERVSEGSALGDFPECAWISAKNFRGVEKIAGREAFIFESREQKLSLEDPRLFHQNQGSDDEEAIVTVRAALDPQSLLPLTLSWDGQTRTYQFAKAPPQPLVLPPDLAAVVEKSNQRAAQAVRPLARP
jgi:hypothetical protein